MSALAVELGRLRARIDALPETKELSKALDGLRTREDQFVGALNRAQKILDSAGILRELDIGIDSLGHESVGPARASLVELQTLMQHEPKSVLEFDFKGFHSLLGEAFRSLDAALMSEWSEFVRREARSTDRGVLEALAQVPALRADATEILELQPRIDEAARTLPATKNDLEEVLKSIRALNEAWGRLGGAVTDPNVRAFLTQAGTGGAPIDGLMSEVLDWLRQNDLLAQFKVVSGAPPERD